MRTVSATVHKVSNQQDFQFQKNLKVFQLHLAPSASSSCTSNSSHKKEWAPLQAVSLAGLNCGKAFHDELHLHDQYTVVGACTKCRAPAYSKPVNKSYSTRVRKSS